MKKNILIALLVVAFVVGFSNVKPLQAAPILQPGRGGGILAPIALTNLLLTVISPFVVTGTASSTITGDGSTSTIRSLLIVNSLSVGTTSPQATFEVNGNVQFVGSSTVVTPVISGAITGIGCDSATTTVDSTISSSTAAFVTSPMLFPGTGAFFYSYLSAPGLITTNVCSDVTLTPSSTSYVVKIIK